MISLESVTKEFGQGSSTISVLNNLNMRVEEAETVAVIGQSGSGKSTLLSLLAGLDRPSRGSVKIFGRDITSLSEIEITKLRCSHIGIVFQQFHLMAHLTALENVALPLEIAGRPHADEIAKELLKTVGLKERTHHFPSQLSGGENQRVAIARALIMRPKLLLADEPSGSLDTKTGDEVRELLFSLVRENKTTLILVTHDETLANRCGRKLILSGGKFRAV